MIRYHFISTRMAKLKMTDNPNAIKDVEQLNSDIPLAGTWSCTTTLEKCLAISLKGIYSWASNPTPKYLHHQEKWKYMYTNRLRIFIPALWLIALKWKNANVHQQEKGQANCTWTTTEIPSLWMYLKYMCWIKEAS